MSEPQNPTPEEPTGQAPPPPPPPPGYTQPGPGYGDPGQAAAAAAGIGQPADLVTRFLARLIDGILLGITQAVVVGAIIVAALMGESGGYGFGPGSTIAAGLVGSILGTAINIGYFAYLESTRGQTVGKMLLKLETRGPGGGHPTLEQAVKRNAFYAIGLASWIPILGIFAGLAELAAVIYIAVTINNSPTKQGWHDQFAGGTSVIKIG